MMKVGIISNLCSQRNKRGLSRFDEVLTGCTDVLHAKLERTTGMPEALADFARREVGLLVLNGGDGTVQAALTGLLAHHGQEPLPLLAVLPSGMTNMIANDVGAPKNSRRALARLIPMALENRLEPRIVKRTVIRMNHAPERPPLYGMFFGSAGICRAIQVCRQKVHVLGIEASAAARVTLAGLVAGYLLRPRALNGVFRGESIGVGFDGEEITEDSYLLVLATTLERLVLNSRPFWGRERGPLRYTSIAYPPARLARSIIPLLYGGPDRKLPRDDYFSRNVNEIRLSLECPYTLDGEIFEPIRGAPVLLSCGPRVGFIRL